MSTMDQKTVLNINDIKDELSNKTHNTKTFRFKVFPQSSMELPGNIENYIQGSYVYKRNQRTV